MLRFLAGASALEHSLRVSSGGIGKADLLDGSHLDHDIGDLEVSAILVELAGADGDLGEDGAEILRTISTIHGLVVNAVRVGTSHACNFQLRPARGNAIAADQVAVKTGNADKDVSVNTGGHGHLGGLVQGLAGGDIGVGVALAVAVGSDGLISGCIGLRLGQANGHAVGKLEGVGDLAVGGGHVGQRATHGESCDEDAGHEGSEDVLFHGFTSFPCFKF